MTGDLTDLNIYGKLHTGERTTGFDLFSSNGQMPMSNSLPSKTLPTNFNGRSAL